MSALEILVRGPNWTGDLVMATPGFRALRAGFPGARITLHVRSALARTSSNGALRIINNRSDSSGVHKSATSARPR